jgi:hypothetical protein
LIHKKTRNKIGVIVCNLSQFTSCTFKNPNATKKSKSYGSLEEIMFGATNMVHG